MRKCQEQCADRVDQPSCCMVSDLKLVRFMTYLTTSPKIDKFIAQEECVLIPGLSALYRFRPNPAFAEEWLRRDGRRCVAKGLPGTGAGSELVQALKGRQSLIWLWKPRSSTICARLALLRQQMTLARRLS
jgi:hypothetical protein